MAATLKTESSSNDVIVAILAVATFEAAIGSGETRVPLLTQSFVSRHGFGVRVGGLAATLLWYFSKQGYHSPSNAVQNTRLVVLIGVLATFKIVDAIPPKKRAL